MPSDTDLLAWGGGSWLCVEVSADPGGALTPGRRCGLLRDLTVRVLITVGLGQGPPRSDGHGNRTILISINEKNIMYY